MGLLRIGGGISGILSYLVNGLKQGQKMSRDELDERVVLYGDLELTGMVIDSMNVKGEKYLHLTFSVKERDLPIEKFREIDQFLREKITAAYGADELSVYSELQRPKIKNVLNKTTGERHERLDHIHYVIPEKNLITGKKENPVGFFDHNVEFFEAIQELANIKFGLASPKDNARANVSHADIVARVKDADTFKKGAFKDLKSELINDMLVKNIKDYESLQQHLRGLGAVKVVNAGKKNEYLGVKEFGKAKFINLREPEFRKDFFELPDADRAQTLGGGHAEKQSTGLRPKRTETEYEATVEDWVKRRSKEVRYLNSGSKVYARYYAAKQEEKAEILAYYEQRAEERRSKVEKEHDDKYREQGRSNGSDRLATLARDAGERIFAERAEQRQFARAMGGDHKPGLAVTTLGEPAKFGDRMHSLSKGDLASQQSSPALLVQANAHNDVEARRPVTAGDELQRSAASPGRSCAGINPATGRTSDTVAAQLLRDEQEAARQDAGAQQPTIQEIKTHLDAKRLLADLAVSHLVRPEDYVISRGRNGGARIRHVGGHHGSLQRYNVSDFLTKHLHLSWSETQPYLAASYERQKNAEPVQKVAAKPRRDLWAEFQAERRIDAIAYPAEAKRDQERQRASEIERRSEINDRFLKAKARIAANPDLPAAQRKAQRSIAQMNKVEQQRLLGLEIQREREELKRVNSPPHQYRTWLQGRAQAGDKDALVELRGQNTEPMQHIAFQRIIAAVNEDRDNGKLLEQAESNRLRYKVEQNGDVTYFRSGRELFLDTGRKIYVTERSEESIEQSLRLAMQKWGSKMQLTGTEAFINQTIQVAALKNMPLEFTNPNHAAALRRERENLRRGQEALDKHAEVSAAAPPEQNVNHDKSSALSNEKKVETPRPNSELEQEPDDDDFDRDRQR